jgi:AraC-like DNA-binding protein
MIVANDCMILHIFQMSDGETGEEVPMDVIDRQPAEREAELMQANREELVERIGRAMREDGAAQLLKSVSRFHHHFKAVTAMSPLQFQKQLRLQEARRLMLDEDLDAASAAYRVGYRDASHFNREYKSLFGVPPMHDVQRLRQEALERAGR